MVVHDFVARQVRELALVRLERQAAITAHLVSSSVLDHEFFMFCWHDVSTIHHDWHV